jgi:peptidoglycan/xylan/chitin deacetylase (PgdA/CDA1 family)
MRVNKSSVLTLMKAVGVFALARWLTRRSLRILCYHGVWETPGFAYGDRAFISPEQFAQRMHWLRESGYPVLPLDEAVTRLADGNLPSHATVITIDDGWASTATAMVPTLATLQLPATVYVTTWYLETQLPIFNKALDYVLQASPRLDVDLSGLERHSIVGWGVVRLGSPTQRLELALKLYAAMKESVPHGERVAVLRDVAAAADVDPQPWLDNRQFHLMRAEDIVFAAAQGVDVQLHTHRHIDVSTQIDDLAADVADNRLALQTIVPSAQLNHFCYPSGTYHRQADTVLANLGVRSATLIESGINPPGSNPYRLRRFVDGRSVPQIEFEAYLAGVLHFVDLALSRLRRS